MKKFLILLIAVLAAGAIAVYLNFNSTAKRLIEEAGTAALGTPVHVSSLTFSFPEMKAAIGKLTIDNPKPYGNAFLKTESITFSVADLSRSLVTLNEVVVDGMTVTYYVGGKGGTNIDALRRNMKSTSGKSEASAEAPKLIIKKLRIINAKLVPHLPGIGEQPVAIPPITMTDIGTKDKPATAAEVARQVVPRVMNAATNAATKASIMKPVGKVLDGAEGAIKGLFK